MFQECFEFQVQECIVPHCVVILPNSNGMQLLLCYDSKWVCSWYCAMKPLAVIFSDEGVYVNTYGKMTKNEILQWGEMPTSVGKSFLHTL